LRKELEEEIARRKRAEEEKDRLQKYIDELEEELRNKNSKLDDFDAALERAVSELKKKIHELEMLLYTYKYARQFIWEHRVHNIADPRNNAWQVLPPDLAEACEEAIKNGEDTVEGEHHVDGHLTEITLKIGSRKCIMDDEITGTELITPLRRRAPFMKLETVGTGMTPTHCNYLGFPCIGHNYSDGYAVLATFAEAMPEEDRPPALKHALEETFTHLLGEKIPEHEPEALFGHIPKDGEKKHPADMTTGPHPDDNHGV